MAPEASPTSLVDEGARLLAVARDARAGRAAHTLHGGEGHKLRQTLIALTAGTALGEHESPGEATLQVVSGSVTLHAGGTAWPLRDGHYLVIPPLRHDLAADQDSVVLLTVALTG